MRSLKVFLLLFVFPVCTIIACQKKDTQSSVVTDPVFPSDSLSPLDCKQCLVITDQAVPAIDIVDARRGGQLVWSWRPSDSNIDADKVKWFSNLDDAKPVYNMKYLLVNASGGGVALVRIADKEVIFYAYVGKNPHSSELLPDGNIVTASSTDNRLVVFHVDTVTAPEAVYKKVIPLHFAHNVVWDRKRQVLWSAGNNYLYALQYNFNCKKPDLIKKDSFLLPGNNAHDLFPVYGKDSLWYTNPHNVYTIDMKTKKVFPAPFKYKSNLKSVSSGPTNAGWRVIIMKPVTKWWSDKVLDSKGQTVFTETGMKIYKARWFLPNTFSYKAKQNVTICK